MKKSVLVVDDEQGFLDLYVYILEPMGLEVICAKNGKEAVEKFKDRSFDLVLMDVHMPEMTGPEALRVYKEVAKYVYATNLEKGSLWTHIDETQGELTTTIIR